MTHYLRLFLHFAIFTVIAPFIVVGDPSSTLKREDQLKAAYIYKFLDFIEWNDTSESGSTFHEDICIVGIPKLGDAIALIDQMQESKHHNMNIHRSDSLPATTTCKILFVSQRATMSIETILAYVNGRSILTVSDIPTFAKRGGMIELVRVGKTIKFHINNKIARSAGIRISSQLLGLAQEVYDSQDAS